MPTIARPNAPPLPDTSDDVAAVHRPDTDLGPAARSTRGRDFATCSEGSSPGSTRPTPRRRSVMNEPLRSPKLKAWHLDRRAIVYVRQSTPQQVADHQESTARQYASGRPRRHTWAGAAESVLVIDEDLGRSGESAEGRPGFQRLLAEVALDHVGLILGLEMSRLARSCKDWHQLLELCAPVPDPAGRHRRTLRPDRLQRPTLAGPARDDERGGASYP